MDVGGDGAELLGSGEGVRRQSPFWQILVIWISCSAALLSNGMRASSESTSRMNPWSSRPSACDDHQRGGRGQPLITSCRSPIGTHCHVDVSAS